MAPIGYTGDCISCDGCHDTCLATTGGLNRRQPAPDVGSSQTNSEMELAFGYNGTERLLGQTTGTGAAFRYGQQQDQSDW